MEKYLLIATISSIAFYAIYYLFLRKESFHQFNRFYLLSTLLISLLIPFVRFSVPQDAKSGSNISGIITYIHLPEVTITAQAVSGFNISHLLWSIYVFGVIVFLLLFIIKLIKISLLIIQSEKIIKGKFIYVSFKENLSPFSFFNYIFINSEAFNEEDMLNCKNKSKEPEVVEYSITLENMDSESDEEVTYEVQITEGENLRYVEQLPEFKGGMDALYNFIRENLVYPKNARDKEIQGTVIVEFVVKKDGSVGNVKATNSVDPELDAESVRIIKTLPPNWIPGKMNGKPVNCYYNIPISYKIQ
jgi:TonB family protein